MKNLNSKTNADNCKCNDIRGYCKRNCIYSDNGICNMWDDIDMPDDVNDCDKFEEDFLILLIYQNKIVSL